MDKKEPSVFHSIPWLLGWASLTVMGPFLLAKVVYKTAEVLLSHLFDKEKELQGKVVLLTGASSGLGRSLAYALYKRGCRLILASRNVEALEELKENLIKECRPTELHIPTILRLDLEDLHSIPEFVEVALKTHNFIDILINNAGISYRGEISSTDISVDLKLMITNYLGQIALTKAVLKSMISHKSGHIVGISSVQGKIALPYRSSYTASKHAFQGFLDCLRAEVAPYNIDVSVICPGYIRTSLSRNAITDTGDVYGVTDSTTASGMSPESVAERIVRCLVTKESEVLLCPLLHRLVVFVRFCLPSLFFFIMKFRASSKNNQKKLH